MFGKKLNTDLPLWARVEMAVYELSGKEKIPSVGVNNKGYADILLGHERTHYHWFPWKGSNCKQYFILLTP